MSPKGSDVTGNGSAVCPYVTITKALAQTLTLSAAATIMVESGTASAPAIYGNGCTAGGGKCDATPIRVTDGMNHGIIIQGSAIDPAALKIVGGASVTDTSVVLVTAPNVGFQNLTIQPTKVATGSGLARVAGAVGIQFAAPPSLTAEATITNIVVNGVVSSNLTESTGSGIAISNGTSPTIGPGVTITGGDHSVLVGQQAAGAPAVASHPVITSSLAAPSLFQSSQFAGVRVESTNAGASAMPSATLTATATGDPGRLHLKDCGGNGAVVVDTVKAGVAVDVTNTLIDSSSMTAAAYYGIRLRGHGVVRAGTAVTITGINELSVSVGAGVEADDSSSLTLTAGVVVTQNTAIGIRISGSASAVVDGVTSTLSRDGLLCDAASTGSANLVLRNSTFVQNRGIGVFINGRPASASCSADLGSVSAAGNNVFNKTAQKNGTVGLCYASTLSAVASKSTWGCGVLPSAGCQAASTVPAPLAVTGCDQVGDYNQSAALTVAVPQTCCGM